MLDKIKYIAAHQVAPVSGITHIAEVERIDKYKDTNKYILCFKTQPLKSIKSVLEKRKAKLRRLRDIHLMN